MRAKTRERRDMAAEDSRAVERSEQVLSARRRVDMDGWEWLQLEQRVRRHFDQVQTALDLAGDPAPVALVRLREHLRRSIAAQAARRHLMEEMWQAVLRHARYGAQKRLVEEASGS